ncbi:hypothetical protein IC232_05595 [Microvirga sp. BT688]|uniref:hypothetical protein n=1 Tax=Microvirga sp. TaxID=1873136 RepID=UPI0016895DF5|nr:hypothetical protein [Microvirga sp.]MBD2746172.1 hypothetical protein [Microvirga sp.]
MSQPCTALGDAEAQTTPCRDSVEQKIIRAYVRLMFAPEQGTGSRTITIMRVGTLDVRLTEHLQNFDLPTFPPLWVELYSPESSSVVAYCGCYEFDEDELDAAVELVLSAYTRLTSLQ